MATFLDYEKLEKETLKELEEYKDWIVELSKTQEEFNKILYMTKETIDNLKNRLIKLLQQLVSSKSNEMKVFIYNDNWCNQVFNDYDNIKGKVKEILTNDKFLLDKHKIATFFISAIIKNKPILLKINKTDIANDDLKFIW